MVDPVRGGLHTHGHHRSVSSLASSIMPITSDISATTSLTASPIEAADSTNPDTEAKIAPSDQRGGEDFPRKNGGSDRGNEQAAAPSGAVEETALAGSPKSGQLQSAHPSTPPENQSFPDAVQWQTLVQKAEMEGYERQRFRRLQQEMEQLRFSEGLEQRLQATSAIAYGNMIDQFKGDDQAGFTGLFEASERLSSRCAVATETATEVSLESPLDPDGLDDPHGAPNLAQDEMESILCFLNRLRTDLDYLSDLISNLPPSDLSSLTSSYHPAGVDLSILPNHSHGRTDAYSRDSQMMKLSRRMDNIEVFHIKDPYFALLHTVFDSSARPDSQECQLRREVWTRTCAKVATTGREGSEEFIIATIDSFTSTEHWALQDDFELYVSNVIAEGWFILDPPVDDSLDTPGTNWEPERASHAIAVAEFFDRHVETLLSMLASGPESLLPADCLAFVQLTLSHIQNLQTQDLVKKFIVSRWYFASFVTSSLVYPEVRGLCLDQHIGHSARQKILQRLALHVQSQIFSVLAPSSARTYILPEVRDRILKISSFFDPPDHEQSSLPASSKEEGCYNLMMSPWDIVSLVECLHPERLEDDRSVVAHNPSTINEATSTATMPNHDTIAGHESNHAQADQFADSTSTDTTYVDEASQCSTLPPDAIISQQFEPIQAPDIMQALSTKRASSLVRAVTSLRSIAPTVNRNRSRYVSKEWLHFRIDSTTSLLSESSMSTTLPALEDAAVPLLKNSKDIDQSTADYQNSRHAVLSILSRRAGRYDPGHQLRSQLRDPLDESFLPLLELEVTKAYARHDFVRAHRCRHQLTAYNALEQRDGSAVIHAKLSQDVCQALENQTRDLRERSGQLESRIIQLNVMKRAHAGVAQAIFEKRNALRVKMWYSTDVKNSAPYEDSLRATRALRAMIHPKKQKQGGGLASWARQRLRGSSPYDRADKQALEAMSANTDQGGLQKLGDEQIDLTTRWISKNKVELFCQGEEKIYRFLYEVQKLVQKLAGPTLLESPVLWSSHLFRQEKRSFDIQTQPPTHFAFTSSPITPPLGSQTLSGAWPSPEKYRVGISADRSRGSLPFNGLQLTSSPTLGNAAPFRHGKEAPPVLTHGYLSPPMTPLSPRPVAAFGSTATSRVVKVPKAKQLFVDSLWQKVTGLVNSDLGYLLWIMGTETDVWTAKAIGQTAKDNPDMLHPHTPGSGFLAFETGRQAQEEQPSRPDLTQTASTPDQRFDQFNFRACYGTILKKISLSQNPHRKFDLCSNLYELVLSSLESSGPLDQGEVSVWKSGEPKDFMLQSNLARVKDQCRQRYTSAAAQRTPKDFRVPLYAASVSLESSRLPKTVVVEALQAIFLDPSLRPMTLFRDLQSIAALVPSNILDRGARGLAFWAIAIAAMSVKETLLAQTITSAQAITEYHLLMRGTHPPLMPPDNQSDKDRLSTTTLKDAADLWLIGAKEGNPIAARELALFYLTHPELLKRTTAPMAKGKDIFGKSLPISPVGTALDPRTFCVILHWMGVAAAGGDQQAIDFLRENQGKKA